MKRILIILPLLLLACLPASAQADQQDLNREVTLYNPYKPSLPEFRKRSFLPDIKDTSKLKPEFTYDVDDNTIFTGIYDKPDQSLLHCFPIPFQSSTKAL